MTFLMIVGCIAANAKTIIAPYGQFENQAWDAKYFYATRYDAGPADNWYAADFDDSEWGDIQGPISLAEQWSSYPALDFIGTVWQENYSSYWIRRHFTIENLDNDGYLLYIIHDDGATVYLNGVQIYQRDEALKVPNYNTIALDGEAKQALKKGDNVLAIYVSDSGGGQALMDVGLYGYNFADIVTDNNVSVTFTNDAIHPWVVEDETAIIRGNNEDNYYSSSWLTMTFTLTKDTEMSFEWASRDYYCHDGLQLLVDGIHDDYLYNNPSYTAKSVFLKAGSHIVAFRDSANYRNSGENWSGIRNIQFKDITQLAINVSVPGSLGDSILSHVENFTDVQSLKLSGKLNDDDIYNLKNRLTNLYELDLEEVDWKDIPVEQFRDKTNLLYVVLPANVQTIGNNAFYNCQRLRSLTFPGTLKSIGSYAFYRTYAFTDIILPEGLTSLGSYAFSGSRIKAITLPSTLKTISSYTFNECDYLTEVNFNGQTTIGNYAFYSCDRLDDLKMPETLQSIGYEAFYNNLALKSLELNEGLTSIGDYAFIYCKDLAEVVLPSSLITIGSNAFYDCNSLQQMTCSSIVPPSTNNYNVTSKGGLDLYVPLLSVNVYKQTGGWDQFNIHGIDIMPDNITIMRDYNLNWPDSLSLDYRPNVTMSNNGNTFGSLTVNGNSTLSMGTFLLKWDENLAYNDYYYDNSKGRSYYNRNRFTSLVNNATARADEVTVELWVKAGRWAFLTVPFDVKVGDIRANFEGTPFVIRKYDGQKRAEGLTNETWVDMTADSTLHAGQGYIWKSASTDSNRDYNGFYIDALQTTNKNNLFANQDISVGLEYFESEFEHNRSWNLIGNPFPCFFDIHAMQTTAPITIWDNYRQNYEALSPMDDAYVLNPGQAFFVQRPVDEESITFLKEGRQTNTDIRDITYHNSARVRTPQAERSVFNVLLSSAEQQGDHTRLVVNAAASSNYEQGRDASKFMSLEQQSAQLYTLGSDDVRYAINERPLENGTVRLGMQLPAEGLYTLALQTTVENEVFLVDQLSGTEVRLDGNAEGYTFHAEAGTLDGRFLLRLGNGQVTGIENIQTSNLKPQDSDLFDLQGRRISQPQQKGIYVKDGRKTVVK